MRFICIMIGLILGLNGFSQEEQKGGLISPIESFEDGAFKLVDLREKALKQIHEQKTVTRELLQKQFLLGKKKKTDTLEVFYPREKMMLMLWGQYYDDLLSALLNSPSGFHDEKTMVDELKKTKYELLNYYGIDSLFPKIIEFTNENYKLLQNRIEQNAALAPEEKDLLIIFLKAVSGYNSLENVSAEYIYRLSDQYVNKYPNSEYKEYVKKKLAPEFENSMFGFGGGFYSGYNMIRGSLGKYFGNGVPVGANIDLAWHQLRFSVDFSGVTTAIIESFEYDEGNWSKNRIPNISIWKFSFSYEFPVNDKNIIMPFAGLASTGITAVKDDDGVERTTDFEPQDRLNISHFPSYVGGISWLLKLKEMQSYRNYYDALKASQNKSYWYLKFNLGYLDPQFQKIDDRFDAGFIYFNIGIGTFIIPQIRKPRDYDE